MAEEQSKVTRKIVRAIGKQIASHNTAAIAPQMGNILAHISSKLGGEQALAEMIIEDLESARTNEVPCPAVVQSYHRMLLSNIAESDRRRDEQAGKLAGLSDEELRDLLRPICVQLMKEDREFYDSVIREFEQPGVIETQKIQQPVSEDELLAAALDDTINDDDDGDDDDDEAV